MTGSKVVRASGAPKDRAGPSTYPLSFAEFLETRLDDPGKRKGERTRDRLKAATTRLLERAGYRDLRVTDINEEAGVSNALFYVYFQNKDVITREVLTDFLAYLETFRSRDSKSKSTEEGIYIGNLRYTQMFKANAGLMRCLFQFSDEFPDFALHWQAWNANWRDRVVRALNRAEELKQADPTDIMFSVAALGSMVDAYLRMAFIDKDSTLIGVMPEDDVDKVALRLTRLWVRGLFSREMRWPPDA